MKRIKGTKYESKMLLEKEIESIEQKYHFEHIGTEVIKDSDLRSLPAIDADWYIAVVNEGIIYIPFSHPDSDKYDYSVCEIFRRREGE